MTRVAALPTLRIAPPCRASPRVRARHEAGHCVVALALGWRPSSVDVEDTRDAGGTTRYHTRRAWCAYSRAQRMRRLAVAFGGVEAERRVCRASVHELLGRAGAGDLAVVADLLDGSYGPWPDAPEPVRRMRDSEEEEARCIARALVREHWRAVEAVARALERRGRLAGEAVFRIATRASPGLARTRRPGKATARRPVRGARER
jgi:hypothetical protein